MKSTRSSDMAVSFPWVLRAWTGREPRTHRPRCGVFEETHDATEVGVRWRPDGLSVTSAGVVLDLAGEVARRNRSR
jgi:hypothetical protein